jgi:signal transduction histidine kinase
MMAYGDKDAINQVIYNLCHNAIKFSYEGAKYRVSLKYDGENIKFTMFNQGIGIANEDLPFVFDRFYKSDKSRGLDKSGTGLGLFICKTIVDAHSQSINAKSEFSKWCEMSFTISRHMPKGENE